MSSPVILGQVSPSSGSAGSMFSSGPVNQEQAFPALTPAQIDRIRPFGRTRQTTVGEILFEPGDATARFFVLLSGALEIVQPTLQGERLIVTHQAGGFTGEMTMISGRGSLARGRVTAAGEFLELSPEALRILASRDEELSGIFMRAFILRRVLLISSGGGNVILLGSRHSAKTLHLREFLTRNGHPHTYIDLDTETGAQELLDRFTVTAAEIPVVICNGDTVLRGPSIQELAKCLGLNAHITTAEVRDLVIVGAGPAGLAAAVYGASEGLDVLVIEAESPGGQAGSSSKIENYLGFPMGITGNELAGRAAAQAQKFGAKVLVAKQRDEIELRAASLRVERGLRPNHSRPCGRDCQRGAVQQASHRQPEEVRRPGRLLRSHLHRSAVVRKRGSGCNRRRELGRTGRGLFIANREQSSYGGAGAAVGGHDVALPDPADRGESRDRTALPHRDCRSRRRYATGARDLAG